MGAPGVHDAAGARATAGAARPPQLEGLRGRAGCPPLRPAGTRRTQPPGAACSAARAVARRIRRAPTRIPRDSARRAESFIETLRRRTISTHMTTTRPLSNILSGVIGGLIVLVVG